MIVEQEGIQRRAYSATKCSNAVMAACSFIHSALFVVDPIRVGQQKARPLYPI